MRGSTTPLERAGGPAFQAGGKRFDNRISPSTAKAQGLRSRPPRFPRPASTTLSACGLELPLGCHFRLAAEEGAQIGLPELDLGAMPAWGGSARLTKRVGEAYAIDMILRAKKISGPEAYRIGLVHEVWPLAELKDRAIALAQELSLAPASAVRAMLGVIVDGDEKSLLDLIAAEQAAVAANRGSADSREGMQAFLEKRKAEFKGV